MRQNSSASGWIGIDTFKLIVTIVLILLLLFAAFSTGSAQPAAAPLPTAVPPTVAPTSAPPTVAPTAALPTPTSVAPTAVPTAAIPTSTPLPTAAVPTPTAEPTPEPTPTPTPEPAPTPALPTNPPVAGPCSELAVGCSVWVTREGNRPLRLRSGPGSNQAILEWLPVGMQLELLEGPQQVGNIGWWRVRTPANQEGWVAGSELRLQPD